MKHSSSVDVMEMLTRMEQNMRERDYQLKAQLKDRDIYFEEELRRRDQLPDEAIKQRDLEWREELQ